uniref:Cyclic nucleotide-binding domain-containing protein n=1 Tax=Pyrodinium bahamense TaxID=73915 RepID=A0A7S0BCY6_9DINO|mmetsp:Transcript_9021/g.25155  ORF Transcript_9021/g.25155 Transcript_9021/m.25155 type:complete len:787 (+) Transcript_9021:90-2450(+)
MPTPEPGSPESSESGDCVPQLPDRWQPPNRGSMPSPDYTVRKIASRTKASHREAKPIPQHDGTITECVGHLSKVPRLRGKSSTEKRALAESMTVMQFNQGDVITQEGEMGDHLYILYEGCVKVVRNGVEDRTLVVAKEQPDKPYFGEEALARNRERLVSVLAQSRTVEVLALDRTALTTWVLDDDDSDEDGDMGTESVAQDRAMTIFPPAGADPLQQIPKTPGERSRTSQDNSSNKLIDDKLWALGMSHEQIAKPTLQKERDKQERLSKWKPWRVFIYKLSHFRAFKIVSSLLILMNCVCVSIIISNPPGEALVAEILASTYKGLFAFETTIRLVGYAKGRMSGWLRLDLVMLLLAIIDTLILAANGTKAIRVFAAFQVIRVMRILRYMKSRFTPLRVILKALAFSSKHVASAGIFVGLLWLAISICFTALMGDWQEQEQDAAEDFAQDVRNEDFFTSIWRSLLTALEITTGGLCWGQRLFDKLTSSDRVWWQVGGVCVLILVIASSFLIWNLLLGIYVRQVVMISRQFEAEEDLKTLHIGERHVKQLRKYLDDCDMNSDGFISKDELTESLLNNREILKMMNLEPDEIGVLHNALDTEGTGMVSISDFLFGVLKLTGASKTLDMLSIDYRQKMLLKSMTMLEERSRTHLEGLTSDLGVLIRYASVLDNKITKLQSSVNGAKDDLHREIEKMADLEHRSRKRAQQEQQVVEARRKKDNLEARSKIEAQLDLLQGELQQLSRNRQLSFLCAGGGSEAFAVRKAVRTRLDRELGPWLERELSSARAMN